MDCIFCKIIKGEIPSQKIYEDELCLAFFDIDPQAPKHAVIIPKTHIASLEDITAENSGLIAHIYAKVPEIAKKLGVNESGYRVVTNCGTDGGQTVGHIHFHLLGGRLLGWPPG
ncbi:MAG: histidine triad nucleotide-binding protein [Oscillospiraceae bacterium]|nr:histidine triad nucleotide-binding protein [Oscillospiraceae bacterium]